MSVEAKLLATWTFGKIPVQEGWKKLKQTGSVLDAVVTGCNVAEDDPENHTVGYAGYPDSSGQVSLDASVMISPAQCGSVAYVRKYSNVAALARRVMEKTEHVMLVGEGAEHFAREEGFEKRRLLNQTARGVWKKWNESKGKDIKRVNLEEHQLKENHDTIGVLAIDEFGKLCGACSTSGLAFKKPGRVGDSSIIGHGLYVDPNVGAVVATGIGERVMGVCGSFLAIEKMREGKSPEEALKSVLERMTVCYDIGEDDQVAMIALHKSGRWTSAALKHGFSTSICTANGVEQVDAHLVLDGS